MNSAKNSKISAEALAALLHHCHVRTYPGKVTVIRPGEIGDKLLMVLEGSVTVSLEDENGHELILSYLKQYDFIGDIGVFKAFEKRSAFVKTRGRCQMAEISYERFRVLLHSDLREYAVELLMKLGEQLSNRLLSTNQKYQNLAFLDVEERIENTLFDLCKEPDAITHPDGMQLHITRQEIGRIVGCSREMAGRVLKELEGRGVISAHGKTIVVFGAR